MTSHGYIKLYRTTTMNKMFKGEMFCRLAAWVSLLLQVSYEDEVKAFGSKAVNLHPGQMAFSLRKLARDWGWSKSKVERFLQTLEAEGMISTESKGQLTILTVINWSKYQAGHLAGHLTTSNSESSEGLRDTKRDTSGTLSETLSETLSGTPKTLNINGSSKVAETLSETLSGTLSGTQEVYNKKNIKKDKEACAAEDLKNKIGRAAAQLWVQTGIENLLDVSRLATLKSWLEYKNQKHQPLKTTHELHHLVKLAESMTPERFRAMVDFSAGNGYSRLYEDFDKPKSTQQTRNGQKPDYRKYYR